jgi:hypothetical protein
LIGEIIFTECNFVLRGDVGGVGGDVGDDSGACCVAVGGFLGCSTVFGVPCWALTILILVETAHNKLKPSTIATIGDLFIDNY